MLRILILTEDGAKDAHETLVVLVKKMLLLVDPRCQTHRVSLGPPEKADELIARANMWRSTNPKDRPKVASLVRTIATKVAEERGMVLFHIDGDCAWSQRSASLNPRQFEKCIVNKVRALLVSKRSDWTPDEIDRRMSRLCLLTPYYSIEAWVYQNTRHAIRLCQEHYKGADVERFTEWQDRRELVDEVEQIKEAVCLKSMHNLELARSAFPHRDAYQAGTSFAAAVDALRACPGLQEDLARTWQD